MVKPNFEYSQTFRKDAKEENWKAPNGNRAKPKFAMILMNINQRQNLNETPVASLLRKMCENDLGKFGQNLTNLRSFLEELPTGFYLREVWAVPTKFSVLHHYYSTTLYPGLK